MMKVFRASRANAAKANMGMLSQKRAFSTAMGNNVQKEDSYRVSVTISKLRDPPNITSILTE
jgi:hypothetical protein